MSKVAKRILFGTMLVAVAGGIIWLDWFLERLGLQEQMHRLPRGIPLTALVGVLVVMAFGELRRLAGAAGMRLLFFSGLIGAMLLALFPFWIELSGRVMACNSALKLPLLGESYILLMGFVLMMIFAEQMIRYKAADAFRQVSATLLAAVYLGIGLALILRLRLVFGVEMLVLFLAAVKSTDVGAYFVGTAIGRHKLVPSLSPGKSWEGLIGGLVVAVAVSLLIVRLFEIGLDIVLLSPGATVIFALAVGLAGQFADLCESLLKRSAQAKDSGSLVPEFGGVLDIVDSPLLAAPVAIVMLEVIAQMKG